MITVNVCLQSNKDRRNEESSAIDVATRNLLNESITQMLEIYHRRSSPSSDEEPEIINTAVISEARPKDQSSRKDVTESADTFRDPPKDTLTGAKDTDSEKDIPADLPDLIAIPAEGGPSEDRWGGDLGEKVKVTDEKSLPRVTTSNFPGFSSSFGADKVSVSKTTNAKQ